ncbi:unnamed protein product, partial [Prunus brigantina]
LGTRCCYAPVFHNYNRNQRDVRIAVLPNFRAIDTREPKTSWKRLGDVYFYSEAHEASGLVGVLILNQTAWQEFGKAKITGIRENLFAITVQDEDLSGKILELGPWFVMRQCFSVKRWPLALAVEEIDTHLVPFWVQVRRIPLNLYMDDNVVWWLNIMKLVLCFYILGHLQS